MARPDDTVPPARPPQTSQFDFWIGTWDLTWGEGGRGTNVIQKILDDRVVLEEFDAAPTAAFRGMSVSSWDAACLGWRQTWVDTDGNHWNFVGGLDGDRMILSTADEEDGRAVLRRMVFFDVSPDGLEWTWERSLDDGSVWEILWAIHYRRQGR